MATADKLTYLNQTKGKIKDSINLTGANLTNEPFRNYAVVLKDKLAEMLNDPTPIWNNFPKTTATGSTIAVNTYASWFDYSLEGNTTQYTTTGKNLLPTNSFTLVKGSTRTIQINFPTPIPAGTYTISCKITNKSGLTGNGMGWALYDGATNRGSMGAITNSTTSPYKYTRTTTGQATHLYAYIDNSLGDDATITLDEIMLESGSTATTYEPYTNGASPNPTYPQQINNVTGLQEVDICGKNLFDYSTNIISNANINQNALNIYSDSSCDLSYLKCKPNTTYVISRRSPMATRFFVATCKDLPTLNTTLLSCSSIFDNTTTYLKITTPNEANYIVIRFIYNKSDDYETYAKTIQVEKSNEPTSYEPYKGKSYEINLGKNLLDLSTTYATPTNSTVDSEGWITASYDNTSGSSSAFCTYYTKIPTGIIIKPNTAYYVYLEVKNVSYDTTNVCLINLGNNNASYIPNGNIGSPYLNALTSNATYKYSFTTKSDLSGITGLLRTYVQINAGHSGSLTYRLTLSEYNIPVEKFTYSPYFLPIELNKINTYKDYIFKGKGVNLFDKDTITNAYLNTDGTTTTNSDIWTTDFIKVKPSTYYRINNMAGSHRGKFYNSSKQPLSDTFDFNFGANNIIQTSSSAYYIRFSFNRTLLDILQVVEGQELFPYEPYNAKDKWLLHKEIGKVVLNGSEYWNYDSTNNVFINNTTLFNGQYLEQNGVSNYYKNIVNDTITGNYQAGQVLQNNQFSFRVGTKDRLYLKDTRYTNTTDYKSWLSSNNLIVYFVLANPTTTEITNSELINQLNSLELINGLNNITITGDLPAIMDLIALEKE